MGCLDLNTEGCSVIGTSASEVTSPTSIAVPSLPVSQSDKTEALLNELQTDRNQTGRNLTCQIDKKHSLKQCLEHMQKLFQEPYSKFAQLTELEGLQFAVEDASNWLTEDDKVSTALTSDAWITKLHSLGDPIQNRYQESIKCSVAIQDLLCLVTLASYQVEDDGRFGSANVDARITLIESCMDVSDWLDSQWTLQVQQATYDDPVLIVADIKMKKDEIGLLVSALLVDCPLQLENVALGNISLTGIIPTTSDIGYLAKSAVRLLEKFNQEGDVVMLQKAILLHQKALELTPSSDPIRAGRLNGLGNSLLRRFETLGNILDLEEAISKQSEAVEMTPDNHSDKPVMLVNLGISLQTRFQWLGLVEDLQLAIATKLNAISLAQDEHPEKLWMLESLGNTYLLRFWRFGAIEDLNLAISKQSEALVAISDDHPEKPQRYSNLGISFQTRFDRLGNLDDLNLAISQKENAVILTPDGHPFKPERLSSLGNSLAERFIRLDNLEDLQLAISKQLDAVDLTADGDLDKPFRLLSLGHSFQKRFERLGSLVDLDSGISMLSDAAKLTPGNHPERPARLCDLGISLHVRFKRLGNSADINSAVTMQSNSAKLLPDGHPNKPWILISLGNSLQTRYSKLHNLDDIILGISYQSDAIALMPDDHLAKLDNLHNLAISLHLKFERSGNMSELDSAISMLSKVVNLTPDDAPSKAARLCNLGMTLWTKFEKLDTLPDLDSAIKMQSDALDLTSDNNPEKPGMINNLAVSLWARFKKCQQYDDLEMAIAHYSHGALHCIGSPFSVFLCAVQWMQLASISIYGSTHSSCMDACKCVVELKHRNAWLGVDVQQRLNELRHSQNVINDAVACAIQGGHYQTAVEWLEQGQSIVWRQMLQLRTPAHDLQRDHPELSEAFIQVSKELETASMQVPLSSDGMIQMSELSEMASQRHRRLAEKWEQLLQDIHCLPGYEGFLLPKSYSDFVSAASDGPVILLNASVYQCDALIIKTCLDSIQHVPLPGITYKELKNLHGSLTHIRPGRLAESDDHRNYKPGSVPKGSTIEQTLKKLWTSTVEPILTSLSLQKSNDPPRVWWYPTGPFSSMPFHAAGIHNKGLTTMDFVISSYTTTLEALIAPLQASASQIPFQLLAISQAQTPNAPPLPATVQEVDIVRRMTPTSAFVALEGPAATVKETLQSLTQVHWCHLACHGMQDVLMPLDSALLLYDGHLKLSTIMQSSLPNAEFAFLSACQTATGDRELPDEATHLAAGLLFAGFKCVIATLWSIADQDGPVVAQAVYKHLLDGKEPDAKESAQALHLAISILRKKGVPLDRWVPFIHIGK